MARKSRKSTDTPVAVKSQLLKTAIYIRLSVEDNKKRGNSVETQTDILNEFIRNHPDLELFDTYCDNGLTGRNFDRPEFARMIADIEVGKLQCVIVKDLSRLGRNSIDTGYYVEKFFPLKNVRFISVVDNFDSLTDLDSANGIILPLKNMINEAYSFDIGRKIKAQQRQAILDGEFVGSRAPYGYIKDPADCHKLIIDEEVADVVRLIFKMASEKAGLSKICKHLNEQGVLSPSFYAKEKGYTSENCARGEGKWQTFTITRILNSEGYTGKLVQGKSQSVNRVQKLNSKDKWVTVENTHEAIISKELFAEVQKIREEMAVHNNDGSWSKNIFKGKIFCKYCGKNLHRQKQKRALHPDGFIFTYHCISNNRIAKDYCHGHIYLSEEMLIDAVRAELINHQDEVSKQFVLFERKNASADTIKKNHKLLSDIGSDITRNKNYLKSLYESLVTKLINLDEYKDMKKCYEDKILELSERYRQTEAEQCKLSSQLTAFEETTAQLHTINSKTPITRELIEKLIEKIIVGDNKKIEVFFSFDKSEVESHE